MSQTATTKAFGYQRIRVTDVLDLLASGRTAEQVLLELPDLEPRGYSGLPPLRESALT